MYQKSIVQKVFWFLLDIMFDLGFNCARRDQSCVATTCGLAIYLSSRTLYEITSRGSQVKSRKKAFDSYGLL